MRVVSRILTVVFLLTLLSSSFLMAESKSSGININQVEIAGAGYTKTMYPLDEMLDWDIFCRLDTGAVDICVVFDTTGSMMGEIYEAAASVNAFVDSLLATGYDFQFALNTYGDGVRFPHGYTFTSDGAVFQSWIAGLTAYGGGDLEETSIDGIYDAIELLPWRPGALHVILMITDAPFHERGDGTVYSDVLPGEVTDLIYSTGTVVYVVSPDSASLSDPLGHPTDPYYFYHWYQAMCDTSGGNWFRLGTPFAAIFRDLVTMFREFNLVSVSVENSEEYQDYLSAEIIPVYCVSLDFGENPQTRYDLEIGDTAVFQWRVSVEEGCEYPLDCFVIHFYNETIDDTTLGCWSFGENCESIPPSAFLVAPQPGEYTACEYQEIRMIITSIVGLDYNTIKVRINSVDYFFPDNMEMHGDTLVFVPTTPWISGEDVNVQLIRANDIYGIGLEDGLDWTFHTDFDPPVYSEEFPADGSILGSTPHEISIYITDEITGLDETSVVLTIGATDFTTASPAAHWDAVNERFVVDMDATGMDFGVGDTICPVLSGAEDTPDLCDPNVMEPYSWCFIIDRLFVWVEDTAAYRNDTLLIPVWAQEPERFGLTSMEISFCFNPEIYEVLDIINTGALTESWTMNMVESGEGMTTVSGAGPALTAGSSILFFLQVHIRSDATQGGFSPINICGAEFDRGEVNFSFENAILIILWDPVQWLAQIRAVADAEVGSRTLSFGTNRYASDNYNPGLDIIALPPIDRVDVYFPLDDPIYPYITKLDRDVRYYMEYPICWTIYAAEAGTLYWNPDWLPAGEFIMNGYLNMHQETWYRFTAGEEIEICFWRTRSQPGVISLVSGWNLISFPVVPVMEDMNSYLPTMMGNPYWYNPVIRVYEEADALEKGKGYWIYSMADTSYVIAGTPVDNYIRLLNYGWNLIGTVREEVDILNPMGYLVGSIYGWDAGGMSYVASTSLVPWQGYWALIGVESCTLNVFTDAEFYRTASVFGDAGLADLWNAVGSSPPMPPGYAPQPSTVLPKTTEISQNFPNPFNEQTRIEFEVSDETQIRIAIYNMLGEKVRVLTDDIYQPGYYNLTWDSQDDYGTEVSSGIYFYKLSYGDKLTIKQMILLR
ncbi:T9SS type A sorting domain-containing protein [bacterium]|nr:T9SS type A sorting domain-containing protein [bacterium]